MLLISYQEGVSWLLELWVSNTHHQITKWTAERKNWNKFVLIGAVKLLNVLTAALESRVVGGVDQVDRQLTRLEWWRGQSVSQII